MMFWIIKRYESNQNQPVANLASKVGLGLGIDFQLQILKNNSILQVFFFFSPSFSFSFLFLLLLCDNYSLFLIMNRWKEMEWGRWNTCSSITRTVTLLSFKPRIFSFFLFVISFYYFDYYYDYYYFDYNKELGRAVLW